MMDKGVRAHEEHLTVVQAHVELPAPQVCSAGVGTQELDRKKVDAVEGRPPCDRSSCGALTPRGHEQLD